MRTALVAVMALLLAGCGSPPPEDERWWPESCRDDFTPATDTQPGVATVSVPVRLVDAIRGGPAQSSVGIWGAPEVPPSGGGADHACILAFTTTGTDGRAVLRVAPGTWHLLTASQAWTYEAVENVTAKEGMTEVVVPVWPREATFTFNGTLTGVDPAAESETEATFPLFGDLSPDLRRESFRRIGHASDALFGLPGFRLAWENTPAASADLGVRFYTAGTFAGYLDDSHGMDWGSQEEALADGLTPFNRTDAMQGFEIRVSDTGPMVAPSGLPFTVSFKTGFMSPR